MGKSIKFITLVVYKQEEPCEGRLSSTVPWERGSEILLRDPISGQAMTTTKQNDKNEKINYRWTGINDNINIDYGTI